MKKQRSISRKKNIFLWVVLIRVVSCIFKYMAEKFKLSKSSRASDVRQKRFSYNVTLETFFEGVYTALLSLFLMIAKKIRETKTLLSN